MRILGAASTNYQPYLDHFSTNFDSIISIEAQIPLLIEDYLNRETKLSLAAYL